MKTTHLFETPVTDFKVLGKRKKRRTDQINKPEFKEFVRKKLADIPFPIYLYVVSDYANYDDAFDATRRKSLNSYYYLNVQRQELPYIFSKNIVSKFSFDPTGITIIGTTNPEGGRFPLTKWGFIHDLVHGITVSNSRLDGYLEKAERILRDVYERVNRIHYKKYANFNNGAYYFDDFLRRIGTFKAARQRTIQTSEVTTELMTQWIVTKRIEFFYEGIFGKDKPEIDEILRKELDAVLPKIEKCFYDLLKAAQGKIFLTTI